MWKFILAGCLLAAHCFAAAPTLYTPWRAFHGTNGILVVTNPAGVYVGIDGRFLQPASTNLTNWSNLSTNVLTRADDIWTNDAGTVYLVPLDVFEVFTTNLNNEGTLYSIGPLTLGSTSMILSLGTNDVDTSQQSDRVMTSPTNNAALVTLRLSPPTVGAQLLFISNGDTNTAWTIVDGQTNTTGGGAVDTQGDFVANAPGVGLLLKASGEDWIEIGRFDPGGLAPGAMNPTDGFMPVRGDSTTFTNSPFFVTQTGHATMTNINGNTTLITFKSTNSTQQVRVGLTAAGAGLLEGTDGIAITSTGGSSVGIAQGGFQLFFLNGTLYAASNTVHLGGADVPFTNIFTYNAHLLSHLFFSPGTTNALSRSGVDLLYTNATAGGYGFSLRDPIGSGLVQYGIISGGSGKITAAASGGVFLAPDNGSVSYLANTQGWMPSPSNALDLGSSTLPWRSLYLGTNSLFLGPNVYTDNGASLLRNGVAVGGGGSGPSFADLVWTNTGTFIKPSGIGANTNAITIGPPGNIGIGKSATRPDHYWIDARYSVNSNEPASGNIALFISDNAAAPTTIANYSLTLTVDGAPRVENYFDASADNYATYLWHDFKATPSQAFIQIGSQASTLMDLQPTAADGTAAYIYDTFIAHTSGNLSEWKNLGVTHLALASTNGIATPAITAYGAGSAPWQFGMATNTVDVLLGATNAVEIVVNGVAYLIPAKLK